MTQEPFARVVITYSVPDPDPSAGYIPAYQGISPDLILVLRERLKEANFLVQEWDLADPAPWAEEPEGPMAAGDQPWVLLVLPAPGFIIPEAAPPGLFESTALVKVQEAIDAGVPAVFMTSYLYPESRQLSYDRPPEPIQPHDLYGLYLRDHWGIQVGNDFRIIWTVPDDNAPGKYRFDLWRYWYMPLSLFTDQPLGSPLRGQRMIWRDLCPVQVSQTPPAGVTAEPVLAIPSAWQRDTWATRNTFALFDSLRRGNSGYIEPDFEAGDMTIPDTAVGLPVAVAASRTGGAQGQAAPRAARIVAMGVGMSLTDDYLTGNVMMGHSGGGTVPGDPPQANADLVVNSVHWVIGRHQDLAATGLPGGRPLQAIGRGTWAVLWTLCVVVAPMIVAAIGGIVMIVRRS